MSGVTSSLILVAWFLFLDKRHLEASNLTIFQIYFMDTQIWYTIWSALVGALVGLLDHLGEVIPSFHLLWKSGVIVFFHFLMINFCVLGYWVSPTTTCTMLRFKWSRDRLKFLKNCCCCDSFDFVTVFRILVEGWPVSDESWLWSKKGVNLSQCELIQIRNVHQLKIRFQMFPSAFQFNLIPESWGIKHK